MTPGVKYYDDSPVIPVDQSDFLAVRLRLIAALLQRDDLVAINGRADIEHNPMIGTVGIQVSLLLKHTEADTLIDLNEWAPDDEDYIVTVATRAEYRRNRRAWRLRVWVPGILAFALLNALLYIVELKGWV